MSLMELKAFNAVALGGGFVRGAELLRRSQPTVTAQVRALESQFGMELFFRSRGQSAQLTPTGKQLFETTRALFTLEEDAEAILSGAKGAQQGLLRIGAIAPRSAMTMVSSYCENHPGMRIEMRISNSGQVLEWLRSYEVDIGILGAHERDPAFFMRRFAEPEIVMLAGKTHKFEPGSKLTRERFARETLILREQGSETRALMESALSKHGWRAARVFEIASREGVVAAAEAGLGLAPISIAEYEGNAGIHVLRFDGFSVFGEMFIVCMNNRRHIPMIRDAFALDAVSRSSREFL